MYKIIDYAGERVVGGFKLAAAAYGWLYDTYSVDFIHEMQMKVVREEEEDEQSEI